MTFEEAQREYPTEKRDRLTDLDPAWKEAMVDFIHAARNAWNLTDRQTGELLVALEVSYCLGHGRNPDPLGELMLNPAGPVN